MMTQNKNRQGEPWKGMGLALLDYHNGDKEAAIITRCSDGEIDHVRAEVFFREPFDYPFIEAAAVNSCYGRLLDIGAGAGCHALDLQDRGLDVTAIDTSPEAVHVMKERGIRDARVAEYLSLDNEKFDTLLLMMNGIGFVGNLEGLYNFLIESKRLLKKNGQLLFDSADLADEDTRPDDSEILEWLGSFKDNNTAPPEYFGSLEYRIEYKGILYPKLYWLFIGPVLLAHFAQKCGWYCEIMFYQEDGKYLARLSF